MDDVSEAIDTTMQQASAIYTETSSDVDFETGRALPEQLQALEEISDNFYWSWRPQGAAVFRDIDPRLWEICEQNPRLFLTRVDASLLAKKAADPAYLERLRLFSSELAEYLAAAPKTFGRITPAQPAAYFCAEYGVHNSLPNYSGGLGILAGDHLKSASDLGVPLVAIGLLYRFGYFRQRIAHNGWQEEAYSDVFGNKLALSPVNDKNGEPVTVGVRMRGRDVHARAWLAKIGRVSLYLLDTNTIPNTDVDRLITGHLYGGDTETRIVQEKLLGIGGVRLLRKLTIEPSVYHLNEGHSAFLTLELAREYLTQNTELKFEDAVRAVREKCVFTTHTPVDAGNDAFAPNLISECFSPEFIASLKISQADFLGLGRSNPENTDEYFGMTPLAIRMCRSANGVSAKHGEVSRNLWHKMFPSLKTADEVPISSVTNGVHPSTWIAPVFQALFAETVGQDWMAVARKPEAWRSAVASIADRKIWDAHRALKELLLSYIRERTRSQDTGTNATINERSDTENLFLPDALTIGFARRVAAYKRWDLLVSDLDRLLRLVDDQERPIQFVFAGKAHPQDRVAKQILQNLMSINHDSGWQKRAVFIEDYDQEVARYLVHGVDVWMNVPRRPLEASGTSGMKAAMNGVLNLSVLDGWWLEAYDGANGFAVGNDTYDAEKSESEVDAADSQALYTALEEQIVPRFYTRGDEGLPLDWIAMMKNSIATLVPAFSSDRMVEEYLTKIYK